MLLHSWLVFPLSLDIPFPTRLYAQVDGEKLGTGTAALIVCYSRCCFPLALSRPFQPYISSPPSSWRPYSGETVAFSPGSSFKLSSDDLPSKAIALVRDRHLHQIFGDFDDHLEDVSIGLL